MNNPDQFNARVFKLHSSLGIPENYAQICGLPLCREPDKLVDTEPDFYQRPQKLTRAAFEAWTSMKSAATEQGVSLFLISAFRGLDYQHDLIKKKLDNGLSIEQILAVNAAPGYSEHHSGCAVDLGTLACDALTENFEKTEAFQWLNKNAAEHGFCLSYPRDNAFGIDYEPWHWCFKN